MFLIWIASVFACSTADFILLVPDGSVSAQLGSSAVLPCGVSPPSNAEMFEVRWYRNSYNNPVLLYKDLKVEESIGDPQYRGRASLVGDLQKGNVSLKLMNIVVADMGTYVCYVKSVTWYEQAGLNLTVKALGSSPLLSLAEAGDQLNVTCASDGWLPKPTLTWRDKEGNKLTPNHIIYRHDSEGLVSVSSWLLVSPSESEWISCSVGSSDQEIKEARVIPYKGIWRDAFVSTLVLSLIIIITLTVLLLLIRQGLLPHCSSRKNAGAAEDFHESTQEETCPLKGISTESPVAPANPEEQVKTWNKLKTQKKDRLKLTVDPSTLHGLLIITQEGNGVYCGKLKRTEDLNTDLFPQVLSREAFSSGQKYWEVLVDQKEKSKKSWCVGVTQKLPSKKTLTALCYEEGSGIYTSTNPRTTIPAEEHFTTLGLLLDFQQKTLSFYNVDKGAHLHTFKMNITSKSKYFSVISPGIKDNFPVSFHN
ncbi:butyrophilin subfamily 2 member A1-like isoform X1 [Astyanax mexicanus]|uniref:Butyrophilin subfamily 2 member A1-like isoform X1 n=1 Tax=Astyanax mexicanus TaxID=7994 RepID=A0A8T2KJW5_ASTMX|nr:butyrophilin subfamily 2 member A1-like isoform X1 [Astyanax mexicanus]